ncbi:MAG: hypothetical protein ACHQRM_09280 [Bacteroidia bacterium]
MKQKKNTHSDNQHSVIPALISFAYLQEMKEDGTAFEKRKIKSAAFSADHSQLILTSSGKNETTYTILLRSIRKVYSRTDREFDKVIIRGFINIGEDFSLGDRQKITIYLKGHPSNQHVAVKIKKALLRLHKGE